MERKLDWDWCRRKLPPFADLEKSMRLEQDRQRNEDALRYTGCERVIPKDERRVA